MKQYFISPKTHKRFVSLNKNLICRKCGVEIQPFEDVTTFSHTGKFKIFHSHCYEELLLDF